MLSGPIIKDKLFFFANAENRKKSYPSRFYAGYDEKGFSTDMAQKIADKYEEYTGIRESFGSRDVDQRAFNFLGRIDWNIDRNNKLAFRYQYNNSYDDIFSPSSTTLLPCAFPCSTNIPSVSSSSFSPTVSTIFFTS